MFFRTTGTRLYAVANASWESEIATRLQRHADLHPPPAIPDASPSIFPDCPQLNPVFQFIEAHYQQPIQLRDIANVAGYSPAYLTSLVNSQTGRSIKQWIIERRMTQARKLLSETDKSIKKIAIDAGYADTGYFIRQFRQTHGVSPQTWWQGRSN